MRKDLTCGFVCVCVYVCVCDVCVGAGMLALERGVG